MNPSFTRSHETQKLVDLFRSMSVESQMSYSEASRRLGFDVRSSSGAYHSARRVAAKEHGVIIDSIRSFGFVRLAGSGIVKRGDQHLSAIRRRARRGGMEMEIAISQNLTRDEMMLASEKLSRLRIIADTSMPAKSNKPARETPEAQAPVDIRANLRSIGGKK